MIRVVLADNDPTLRQSVASVLEADGDIEVTAEAGSLGEARAAIAKTRPDVVLVDVRLPDGDGVGICEELRESETGVIVLTRFTAGSIVLRAFRRGANGYVVKEPEPGVLCRAVRSVASGATFVDPRVAGRIAAATRGPRATGPYGLSAQETRVTDLLAKRLSNREIARELGISEATVETHLRHAFRKLQVEDRGSAVALAVHGGLA